MPEYLQYKYFLQESMSAAGLQMCQYKPKQQQPMHRFWNFWKISLLKDIKKSELLKTEDTNGNIKKTYYKVTVFFRVDLPIMGEIFTFPVTGETKPIYFPKNDVF